MSDHEKASAPVSACCGAATFLASITHPGPGYKLFCSKCVKPCDTLPSAGAGFRSSSQGGMQPKNKAESVPVVQTPKAEEIGILLAKYYAPKPDYPFCRDDYAHQLILLLRARVAVLEEEKKSMLAFLIRENTTGFPDDETADRSRSLLIFSITP